MRLAHLGNPFGRAGWAELGTGVRKIRLRTKLLLSLVAITVGLTAATLLFLRYSIQQQLRDSLQQDLDNSVRTYRSFALQRQATLSRSAELLADLPTVRALMSTNDAATIQDETGEIQKLSGSDMLALANGAGNVLGLSVSSPEFSARNAQESLQRSLERWGEQNGRMNWWAAGGRLYQVWVQPIYLGQASQGTTLGYLAVGYEVDERAARNISDVAASQVAFQAGNTIAASTLTPQQKTDWTATLKDGLPKGANGREIQLGGERYLETTVKLSPDERTPVYLIVLKSLDKASAFVADLNRVLLALGLFSVLMGAVLVFWISHTFTRPLASLVGGVRALERGDYSYPLERASGDEIAEVTASFESMRTTLQKAQQEHESLEHRLRQAHKMEAVGRLAGGVAHDFNNLLTIIRGHSDLLLGRQGIDDTGRRNVEQIQRASDRAVSMTRQLLAFSRMQVLEPRIVDLNAILIDMGKMLSRLIGEDIEYQFQTDATVATVKADPGQIEQVIMNLTVNARDAMPQGGKLTVQTRAVNVGAADAARRPPMTPGRYVLLTVSDTGQGMDEDTKSRIFDPFFTTKEVGKGTGLGLATVYGVVKQSGGFVWVESTLGKGATFEIYLPQTVEKAGASEMRSKVTSLLRGSETILLVEDEEGVRELAREFLNCNGYKVLEASDGQEALEIAARYHDTIHLLLSDMVMPRMGGTALANALRATRPEIKILLMSGYAEYAGNGNSGEYETASLQKPFSMSSLTKKVRDVLEEGAVPQGRGTGEPITTRSRR